MRMAKQLADLKHLGVTALRTRYAEVFGEETRAGYWEHHIAFMAVRSPDSPYVRPLPSHYPSRKW